MALTLKPVPPARGLRWLRDGFALYARRPLGFAALFIVFLLAAVVVSLVPLAGPLLQMAMLPLLSLGFMVAGQSALFGGAVKPTQFIEPLRGDPARRLALMQLCLLYGACALGILVLADAMSDGAMQRVQALVAKGAPQKEIDAVLTEPGVTQAALTAALLGTLLSVPFWHAPALVHWGGQRAAQALFSSTVAVWRSKGAFLFYALGWVGLILVFGIVTALVFGLFGAAQLASMLALPAGLVFSTVFYVSLLFTFNDSFGGGAEAAPAVEPG